MKTIKILALWLLAILWIVWTSGCSSPPRHQKGGRISQTLGFHPNPPGLVTPRAQPAAGASPIPASQTLVQPENPEGESVQEIRETTTTTTPAGEVVTVVKSARTVIGGSQDLADIMKEYAASEYTRRIALALILAVIAFAVRKEWPSLQWVFGLGAVAVAFYGPALVLAVVAAGGGIVFAYHVVMAKLGAIAAPFPRGNS